MAQAGDRVRRSNQRQMTSMMWLRVHPAERAAFILASERDGYPTLAAWHRDKLSATGCMGLRHQYAVVGQLGQLSGEVVALIKTARDLTSEEAVKAALEIAKRFSALQHDILTDGNDAGEDLR